MSKIFDALQRLEEETEAPLTQTFVNMRVAVLSEAERQKVLSSGSIEAPATEPPVVEEKVPRLPPELKVLGPAEPKRHASVRVTADAPLFPFEETYRQASEQYRIIRTKIVQHPRSPRVMAVCSADPADGKTVTSINLAATLALKTNVRILLIDCDLRLGRTAELLDIPQTPGLTDVLTGSYAEADAIIQVEQFPNLYVLPGGSRLGNPTEVLDSAEWGALLSRLRERFDYILLDSPPIAGLADYELIQAASDGVLFVARPDSTNRARCIQALASIPQNKLIGVILNCVEDWFLARKSFYASYYSYGAGSER